MSNFERMQILLMRAKEDQESQHSEEPSGIIYHNTLVICYS